jgi:hypothetical protein
MSRMAMAIFTMALVRPLAAGAQNAIDFSGTWKMDAARSESAHQAVPIGPVTLVIKQTATELSIETRRSDPDKGEIHSETLTYKLDGSENTVAGTDGTPIKSQAHWEGTKLVTGTTRNIEGSTITTTYVHSLNPKGNELTVHKTLTVQHGYQFDGAKNSGTGTDVFIKVKAADAK